MHHLLFCHFSLDDLFVSFCFNLFVLICVFFVFFFFLFFYLLFVFFFFFFFFQAEDGIRDLTVTGVQTCALPILKRPPHHIPAREGGLREVAQSGEAACRRFSGGARVVNRRIRPAPFTESAC